MTAPPVPPAFLSSSKETLVSLEFKVYPDPRDHLEFMDRKGNKVLKNVPKLCYSILPVLYALFLTCLSFVFLFSQV